MSWVWLLLAGCVGAPSTHVVSEAPLAPGWELGERIVCDAPADEPAWSEVALPSWANPIPENQQSEGAEPGVVGWIEGPGSLEVVSTAAPDGVYVTDVATSDQRTLATPGPMEALAAGDFDGDGTLDLVASGWNVTIWFAFGEPDEREVRYSPSPRDAGAHDVVPVDVDGDGDLDLVVVHNGNTTDLAYVLLRNTGDGTFVDEAIEAPDDFWGHGFDATAWDVDADGDPDLLTCNDRGSEVTPNGLLINDGAGIYAPAEDALGLDVVAHCMGLALGDANEDGRLDVFIADALVNLLLEQTDAGFVDVGLSRGLPPVELAGMVWGNAVVDLDNDGQTDLLANLGDFYVAEPILQTAVVHRQEPDGSFTERSPFVGAGAGRGTVVADQNGDGVPDALLGQAYGSPRLFVSTGCTADHWLEVEAPPGTEVVIEAGGTRRAALASTEHGMGSFGPARVHFGLGAVDTVDRVTVRLPWTQDPVVLEGPFAADRRISHAE